MTNHTDLIARLREGQKYDFESGYPIVMDYIMDEAADAIEAAQAEIEAVRKANIDCVNHFDALRIDYDAALARLAKLEPKRNVSPPSEGLVLHKMRYHFWEADDDGPADFELFDAGVECDTCIDVALVRQDRLDELIAALARLAELTKQEPVAWAMQRADGLVLDVICPEEHESHEGSYTLPLYAAAGASPVQPSQAVEHCLWARNGHQPCQHTQPAQGSGWLPTRITLYAAPAVQPSQALERKYISPVRTVADLANNLLMMEQTLPIYGAQHIEHAGKRRCIAISPTLSRERIKDARWIGEGDELNAAVIWTRATQALELSGEEIRRIAQAHEYTWGIGERGFHKENFARAIIAAINAKGAK